MTKWITVQECQVNVEQIIRHDEEVQVCRMRSCLIKLFQLARTLTGQSNVLPTSLTLPSELLTCSHHSHVERAGREVDNEGEAELAGWSRLEGRLSLLVVKEEKRRGIKEKNRMCGLAAAAPKDVGGTEWDAIEMDPDLQVTDHPDVSYKTLEEINEMDYDGQSRYC
ncbi:hypothetical protein O3P69_007213 [Scylla paramamosain]|uniref:Uncharacterized protein n=1 Tax=Scylla paramamosain TaxID=85552 RepID=A0AAW0V640_SCYPA